MSLLIIAAVSGNTESVAERLAVFLYNNKTGNGSCSNAQPLIMQK